MAIWWAKASSAAAQVVPAQAGFMLLLNDTITQLLPVDNTLIRPSALVKFPRADFDDDALATIRRTMSDPGKGMESLFEQVETMQYRVDRVLRLQRGHPTGVNEIKTQAGGTAKVARKDRSAGFHRLAAHGFLEAATHFASAETSLNVTDKAIDCLGDAATCFFDEGHVAAAAISLELKIYLLQHRITQSSGQAVKPKRMKKKTHQQTAKTWLTASQGLGGYKLDAHDFMLQRGAWYALQGEDHDIAFRIYDRLARHHKANGRLVPSVAYDLRAIQETLNGERSPTVGQWNKARRLLNPRYTEIHENFLSIHLSFRNTPLYSSLPSIGGQLLEAASYFSGHEKTRPAALYNMTQLYEWQLTTGDAADEQESAPSAAALQVVSNGSV